MNDIYETVKVVSSLRIVPCTIKAAKHFVSENHRHHKPPQGGLFAVGVERNGNLCGVAIVGRPVSRMLDDGLTAEVTRLCTDGSKNACSILYGAVRRAAKALGYQQLITYILEGECGTSLKASGWTMVSAQCGGGTWSRPSRKRGDKAPLCKKQRWAVTFL